MNGLLFYISKGLKYILHPPALNHCKIDKTSRVCSKSELTNVEISRYSYLGFNCFAVNTKIGAFCSIADRVCIGGAQHPMQYVSTSPVFHEGHNAMGKNFSSHPIEDTPLTIIGDDVWIGMNANIRAGIRIGTGAVVGTGSVVTKDIGPYEVWAGNPARLIRKRFTEEICQRLLASKWWETDEHTLTKISVCSDQPDEFLKMLEELNNGNAERENR